MKGSQGGRKETSTNDIIFVGYRLTCLYFLLSLQTILSNIYVYYPVSVGVVIIFAGKVLLSLSDL
jgi:hypothetical protein